MQGSHDVFLALHPFRDGAAEFRILLGPLADLDTSFLEGVEGFYAHAHDLALIALRFRRRVVEDMGAQLILSMVRRSGLPVIVVDELSPAQRRQFLGYLAAPAAYVQQYFTDSESVPIVQRVVDNLSAHIESLAIVPTLRPFDLERELPLAGRTPLPGTVPNPTGDRAASQRRPPLRLSTAN